MTVLQKHHQAKLWTKSFIIITLSSFLLTLCLQMLLSPFPAYVKERFHSDDFTLSLVTSLFALAAIAARFMTAALMKKVHRNVLLLVGITIAAGATFAYAYADSVTKVLLLRICFGIGFGMGSTVLPTLISQIIPLSRIGEGIGYFGLSSSLAMSIGPTLGLSLLKGYGFSTLTVAAAIAVMLVLPLLWFSHAIPQKHTPKDQQQGFQNTSGLPPFNKQILFPALLNVLISVTYGGLLGFLALYGQDAKLSNVGLFFLFNACAILLVRPISGRLFDSKGPSGVLIPGATLMLVSMLLISWEVTMTKLIISAVLFGLGFGAVQPSLQAWMLRDSAPERHGTANGLFYNAIDFGVAIGTMLLGVIASGQGYAVMYRYSAGVMVLFIGIYVAGQKVLSTGQTEVMGKPFGT